MPNISEISLQNTIYKLKDDSAASSSHTHTKNQITDFPTSMPASDVYSWAKASSKPSYTASEVGAASSTHKHTKSDITDFPTSMPASDVSSWAKASSKPTYTASEVGAEASGAVNTHNSSSSAHSTLFNAKEDKPTSTTGTSTTVNITVANNTEYSYTNTRYFTLTGANVNCHGFVTFHSSYAPSITVSGFTASSGDDITKAAKGQVWEFSVYTHNSKSYIIWKNWSA